MYLREAYDRLKDSEVLCLEVYTASFIAVTWYDREKDRYVMNVRFGSGRHHTTAGMDKQSTIETWKQHAEENPEKAGANLVSEDGATEIQVVR